MSVRARETVTVGDFTVRTMPARQHEHEDSIVIRKNGDERWTMEVAIKDIDDLRAALRQYYSTYIHPERPGRAIPYRDSKIMMGSPGLGKRA